MERNKLSYILLALALLSFCRALAEGDGPSVVLINPKPWRIPDAYEIKPVGRMPLPAKSIYDFEFVPVDTCDSVCFADLTQTSSKYYYGRGWEWDPIGISDLGDDKILYYHVYDIYHSAVYACLNPSQEGYPSTLLIVSGSNDPWPFVWFEMDGNAITVYNSVWNIDDLIIKDIERYVIENGEFRLVSVQHTDTVFDFEDIDFRSLLFKASGILKQ